MRRKAGNGLLGVGISTMLLGLFAAAAGGVDSGPDYQDPNYELSGSRRVGSGRTTFAFTVKGDQAAGYFLLRPCDSGAEFLRAFGPDDQKAASVGDDPATGHDGVKFEPGNVGTYRVVYRDRVGGAEFIVKNGDGHKHYHLGSGCPEGTEVTTSSSTTTTTERDSTTTTERDSTTTTERESTTTTEEPTTSSTEEPTTSSTEEPTTSSTEEPAPGITLIDPDPSPPSGNGSGTATGLLLAGLPLALSGVAVRFADDDEGGR
jgi:hypothetical protein